MNIINISICDVTALRDLQLHQHLHTLLRLSTVYPYATPELRAFIFRDLSCLHPFPLNFPIFLREHVLIQQISATHVLYLFPQKTPQIGQFLLLTIFCSQFAYLPICCAVDTVKPNPRAPLTLCAESNCTAPMTTRSKKQFLTMEMDMEFHGVVKPRIQWHLIGKVTFCTGYIFRLLCNFLLKL